LDLLEPFPFLLFSPHLLHLGELAVGAADHLDDLVIGDGVAGLAIQDVIQPRMGTSFVPQALEEQQGVGDLPTGVSVHPAFQTE
jgi:hypothetical protein